MPDPAAPPAGTPAPAGAPGGAVVPASGAPAPVRANPFQAVALLLQAVRTSLENSKRPDQAPRWVRIDRVRQFADPKGDTSAIAKGLMTAMGAVVMAISYLQRFTLDATDLLVQGDAAKALLEVSTDLIKQATSKDFINALELAVGQDPSPNSPIPQVGEVLDQILKYVDFVPEPEDLKVIGAQLYGLLAIEQLTTGMVDDTTLLHVDIAKTGKLRLLHWGFWKPFKVQNLGKGSLAEVDVFVMGARRLAGASAAKLPKLGRGTYGDPGSVEVVYELDFTGDGLGKDIAEANHILDNLGYGTKYPASDAKAMDTALATRLRVFQKINDIPVTGALDNDTLNRLVHLDFANKNLKRAKAYRDDGLPAGFDPTKPAA